MTVPQAELVAHGLTARTLHKISKHRCSCGQLFCWWNQGRIEQMVKSIRALTICKSLHVSEEWGLGPRSHIG